jgi:hypothetical protein
MRQTEKIPIAQAALALGLTREIVLRLVQTHALEGGQDGRHWYVTSRSLERAKRDRAAETAPAA